MTRVYSQSQGKFIETGSAPTAQPIQNNVMAAQAGVDPNESLKTLFAGLIMSNPKQYSALNAVFEKLKKPEKTAAEIESEKKKQDSERIVTQLEDFYLNNKLYYGNNIKGFYGDALAPKVDPNSPASKYKALLESVRPYLAKAAGDSGNLAFQEQLQASKPFPTTRFNKKSAEDSFKEIRKKMGLPERNYETSSDSNRSLDSIGDKYGL